MIPSNYVKSIPLRDRLVLQMWLEGLSFRDMGKKLGVTGQRAYTLWHRTLTNLFEAYAEADKEVNG